MAEKILAKAGMNANDVSTATSLCCCVPTLFVGLVGNLPYVMAPGLGLSAFLSFSLVVKEDDTRMTWENGLACVFLAGLAMLFLIITFLVERSMAIAPRHIKMALIVGIGLFLATIGLESAGIVVNGKLTNFTSPQSWPACVSLAILVLMSIMIHFNIPGAILIGVIIAAIALWAGENSWPNEVIKLPSLSSTFVKMDFKTLQSNTAVPAILTFLVVTLLDCSGCLIGMSMKAQLIKDVNDKVPGGFWLLLASALGTMLAGLTGCSPIILSVESTAGILDGGRTGLTAVTAGLLFAVSLFFSPLFGAFPEVASAPVLILIGSFMFRDVGEIRWDQMPVAIPAFLTIVLMPLSHSISNGIWFGLATCLVLELFTREWFKGKCYGGKEIVEEASRRPSQIIVIGTPVDGSMHSLKSDGHTAILVFPNPDHSSERFPEISAKEG